MEVICLQEEAFYALIDKVTEHIEQKYQGKDDKWITDVEAMKILNVKSSTTMQKLRDEGQVEFSQPSRKIILYNRESIISYLDKNAKKTF